MDCKKVRYCENCGEELSENDIETCEGCGEPLCNTCHSMGDNFCDECSEELHK